MTLSREDRIQDLADALRRMTEDVSEQAVWRVDVEIKSERYQHIRNTTWKELIDRGWAKWFTYNTCQLTMVGWRKGIQLLGLDKDPNFRAKLSHLAAVLKDEVKGRHEEVYLDVFHAAERSWLTEDLVYNIIESKLLDYAFTIKGAWLDTDSTIVIPIDFGMPPLD